MGLLRSCNSSKYTSTSKTSCGNILNIDIGKEETEVYFQFEEEILGDPCFIPTNELYKLVLEWKEMEDRMYRGEDVFPLMIED